jgi:hypothetical protein
LCLIADVTKLRCSDVRVQRRAWDVCPLLILCAVRDGNYLTDESRPGCPWKVGKNLPICGATDLMFRCRERGLSVRKCWGTERKLHGTQGFVTTYLFTYLVTCLLTYSN